MSRHSSWSLRTDTHMRAMLLAPSGACATDQPLSSEKSSNDFLNETHTLRVRIEKLWATGSECESSNSFPPYWCSVHRPPNIAFDPCIADLFSLASSARSLFIATRRYTGNTKRSPTGSKICARSPRSVWRNRTRPSRSIAQHTATMGPPASILLLDYHSQLQHRILLFRPAITTHHLALTPQPPTLIIPLRLTRPTPTHLPILVAQTLPIQRQLRCLPDRAALVQKLTSWRRLGTCSTGRRTRRLRSAARLRWRSICESRISFHICSKKRSFAN